MPKTLTTVDFIQRAFSRHGHRYDYSRSIYLNQRTPVEIVCPVHGSFQQRPEDHWGGCGCRQCGAIKRIDSSRLGRDEFISRAAKVHGNKYNYVRVDYINNSTPVEIFCNQHDAMFMQSPTHHLRGQSSCPECATENRRKPKVNQYRGGKPPRLKVQTTERFIAKAAAVHGDCFDYSKTVYTGCHNHLTIICRVHGAFQQMATNHLSGYGCSESAVQQVFHENHIPKDERNDPAHVYVLEIGLGEHGDTLFAKLGYSSCFADRCSRYRSDGVRIWKSHIFQTTKYAGFQIERLLHTRFADRKATPDAKFGGRTECYPIEMREELIAAVDESFHVDNFRIGPAGEIW